MFRHVAIGDIVDRHVAGASLMKLKVTAIDDEFIHCGDWKFDITTGAEIDEFLGWNKFATGSYLVKDAGNHRGTKAS